MNDSKMVNVISCFLLFVEAKILSFCKTGLNFIDIGIICKNKLTMIDFLNFLFFSDLKTLLITSISADLIRFNWNFSYFITLKIDKNRFFLSNTL